jgi:hypothetical protein
MMIMGFAGVAAMAYRRRKLPRTQPDQTEN